MRSAERRGSVVPPLLTLALGVGVLIVAADIRPGMLPNDPGPAFLPRVVGVALIGLSLWLLWDRQPHEGLPRGGGLFRVVMTVVFTTLYLLTIEPIGFPAATALFLLCQMWLIGIRRPAVLATMPGRLVCGEISVPRP